jgi:acetophenone carboxylase
MSLDQTPLDGLEIPEYMRVTPIEISPATMVQWLKPEPVGEAERSWVEQLEPGDYEIYDEKLKNILDEAREIFVRSGVTNLLTAGDLIVAIYTANGDLANASAGTYLHCVTGCLPVKYVMHKYYSDPTVRVEAGDIFYTNEARYGGIHNPDQMAFMPVFHEGELIAWTAALAHQPETGAIEPGGMPILARSRSDEGMKLTPIKIGQDYRIKRDLLDMMVNFIDRSPRMQEIDTRARVTGADRLRVRVQELAVAKGNDFVRGLLRKLVLEAEESARRRIARWNDGIYRAVAFADTIGREPALVRGMLTATKRGDSIHMDFNGTSPENDSSYNAFPHIVAAHAAIFMFAYPFHDLPASNGTLAPFEWDIPEGCVLNAAPNAAISNSPPLCCIVMTSVTLALSKMMFDSEDRDKIGAPNGNMGSEIIFSGTSQHDMPYADLDGCTLNTEGQGARPDMDGVNAYGFPWAHAGRAPDVEFYEDEYPFLRLFYHLRQDSGGFGKWQGGLGTETAIAPRHVPTMFWSSIGKSTHISVASGLFGGYPSSASPGIWVSGTDLWEKMNRGDQDLPEDAVSVAADRALQGEYLLEHLTRLTRIGYSGDLIVQLAAGGGGYGDVLERDPDLVLNDLKNGQISNWTAKKVYQIRYEEDSMILDETATEEARDSARQTRLKRGKPWDEFISEWSKLSPNPDALKYFGTWPEGVAETPVVRI